MENLIDNTSKLSSLLEVVRLTYEEGLDLEKLFAAARLDERERPKTLQTQQASELLRPTNSLTLPKQPIAPLQVPRSLQGSPSKPDREVTARQSSGSQVSCSGRLLIGGPCESCSCTESPQWRRPEPARILLCNRCGIHYGRYKKLPGRRPQDAPNPCVLQAVVTMKRKSTDICSDSDSTMEEQSRMGQRSATNPFASALADGHTQGIEQAFFGAPNVALPHCNALRKWPSNPAARAPIPKAPPHMASQSSCPQLPHDVDAGAGLVPPDSIDYVLSHGAFEFIMSQGSSQDMKNNQELFAATNQVPMQGQHSQEAEKASPGSSMAEEGGQKAALQQKIQQFFSPTKNALAGPVSMGEPAETAPSEPSPSANHPPLTPSPPTQQDQAIQPPRQQHYYLKNGMLMSPDGTPADVTAYVRVLGSLMQQQKQLEASQGLGAWSEVEGKGRAVAAMVEAYHVPSTAPLVAQLVCGEGAQGDASVAGNLAQPEQQQ